MGCCVAGAYSRLMPQSPASRPSVASLISAVCAETEAVVSSIHSEIDHRVSGIDAPCGFSETLCSSLPGRWDVPFNRGRVFRNTLGTSSAMRPLLELAKPRSSSLRGLTGDEDALVVQADDVNEATFLVESGEQRPLSDLSSRMRQRLERGDVLLCTTGSGDQVAYFDDELGHGGQPILCSATFTLLQFKETPRVFPGACQGRHRQHPTGQPRTEMSVTPSCLMYWRSKLLPCDHPAASPHFQPPDYRAALWRAPAAGW